MSSNDMDKFSHSKQVFIKYCLDKESQIPKIQYPLQLNQKLEAVLIEFRLLSHLGFIIKNTIYQLGPNWSFTIICGNLNYDLIRNIVGQIGKSVRIIRLPIDNLTREEYSIKLLESEFWKQFQGDKILIYQEDSIIVKKLESKYLQYDYIGAPFSNKKVGNGGLSLRSKKIMIQICERFFDPVRLELQKSAALLKKYKSKIQKKYGDNYFHQKQFYFFYLLEKNLLEDLQITNKMREYQIGTLPDFKTAVSFSIEKYKCDNCFGGHQFWYAIPNVYAWLNNKLRY